MDSLSIAVGRLQATAVVVYMQATLVGAYLTHIAHITRTYRQCFVRVDYVLHEEERARQ